MADATIANLTDGTTADATDRIPVERSPFGAGTNRYITPAYIKTYLGSDLTSGRVALVGASGVITDDAGLTYDTSTDALTVGGQLNVTGVIAPGSTNGTVAAVRIQTGSVNSGYWWPSGAPSMAFGGAEIYTIGSAALRYNSNVAVGWTASSPSGALSDTMMVRGGVANAIVFSGATAGAGVVTSRTEINKAVTAFTDAVAKATFTVTVPNAAHSATLQVQFAASMGAGGAIGANEATGTISYDFAIARTAGVATVITASVAYGSAVSAVAGADTLTVTAAASAVGGANSATQTFTIDVTISKVGIGAEDNHTCLCYAKLMNANATGVTIA